MQTRYATRLGRLREIVKVEGAKEKKEKGVVRKRQLVLWGRVRPLAEPVTRATLLSMRKLSRMLANVICMA